MIKDTFLISYLQGKWRMVAFEKIWTITEPAKVNKLCISCISSMWEYSLSLFVCLLVVKFSNIWPLKFKEVYRLHAINMVDTKKIVHEDELFLWCGRPTKGL